ncbi:hypothetical protein AB0J83_08510 [Actinoplanes sp. NPDC049596]|uniref:dTMP kinase n=1 Tax=unclassified Actinoplanes TaxID=2626549 RepID=UPI0034148984
MTCVVAVEGIDGAGKSSLVAELRSTLTGKGYSVGVGSRERPLRREYGRRLRTTDEFPDSTLSLFWGLASAYDIRTAALSRDQPNFLILDRYVASPITDAIAAGLDPRHCLGTTGLLPRACVTLLVDVSAELALARRPDLSYAEAGGETWLSAGDTPQERFLAYQSAARNAFLEMSRDSSWLVLDGADLLSGSVGAALGAIEGRRCNCPGRDY